MRQPDSRWYKDDGKQPYYLVLWKNAFRVPMVSVISFNDVTGGWCVTDFKQSSKMSFAR